MMAKSNAATKIDVSSLVEQLTTLSSRTEQEKLKLYSELVEKLKQHNEFRSQFAVQVRQHCSVIPLAVCNDLIGGGNSQIQQLALFVLGHLINDDKNVASFPSGECSLILKQLCTVVQGAVDVVTSSRALWCLSKQSFPAETMVDELQTILNIVEHAVNHFKIDLVSLQAVSTIYRLYRQIPAGMLKHAFRMTILTCPYLGSSITKLRQKALFVLQFSLDELLLITDEQKHRLSQSLKQGALAGLLKLMTAKQGHESDTLKVWSLLVRILGKVLHHGGFINEILSIVQQAFVNPSDDIRIAAFGCWERLIENFAANQKILCDNKRVKLIMQVFRINKAKVEPVALAKLKAWWFYMQKLHNKVSHFFDAVCLPLLHFLFGVSTTPVTPSRKTPIAGGAAPTTPTNASLQNLGLGSPSTPKVNITTLGGATKFKSVQKLGCEMLAHILAMPGMDNKSVKFNIEPLAESAIGGPSFFNKHGIVLIQAVFEALNHELSDDLVLYIWDALMYHINRVILEVPKPINIDVIVHFLTLFQDVIRAEKLPTHITAKMFLDVSRLPKVLSSPSYYAGNTMQTVPAQSLLQVLFESNLLLLCSVQDERFFTIFDTLVKSGFVFQPLKFLENIFEFLNRAADQIDSIDMLWRLWSCIVNQLQDYIQKGNEVNQGDALEHNFNCIYHALLFPVMHLKTGLSSTSSNAMFLTWTDLYNAFARQAALVTNIGTNVWCEETCARIFDEIKKSTCLDVKYVECLSKMCQVMVETVDFSVFSSGLGSRGMHKSPRKSGNRKSIKRLGNLHSLVAVIGHLISLIHSQNISGVTTTTPMLSYQQSATIYLMSTLSILFARITNSYIAGQLLDHLVDKLALMFEQSLKKGPSKLYNNSLLQKLEKLWADISICLQNRFHGLYDSDLLKRLAPLLAITFQHPRRPIKNQTTTLWSATFATASILEYPDVLKLVLMKVKEKSAIILPGWHAVELPVIEETPVSQASQPESQVPMPDMIGIPSPKKVSGSFLNKVLSPSKKSSSPTAAKSSPNPSRPEFLSPTAIPGSKRKLKLPVNDLKDDEFVVIAPSPKRRRILTDHQKEVRRERTAVPAFYNNLDASMDTSLSSQFTDNNTQSQSFLPSASDIETAEIVFSAVSSILKGPQNDEKETCENRNTINFDTVAAVKQTKNSKSRRKSVQFAEKSPVKFSADAETEEETNIANFTPFSQYLSPKTQNDVASDISVVLSPNKSKTTSDKNDAENLKNCDEVDSMIDETSPTPVNTKIDEETITNVVETEANKTDISDEIVESMTPQDEMIVIKEMNSPLKAGIQADVDNGENKIEAKKRTRKRKSVKAIEAESMNDSNVISESKSSESHDEERGLSTPRHRVSSQEEQHTPQRRSQRIANSSVWPDSMETTPQKENNRQANLIHVEETMSPFKKQPVVALDSSSVEDMIVEETQSPEKFLRKKRGLSTPVQELEDDEIKASPSSRKLFEDILKEKKVEDKDELNTSLLSIPNTQEDILSSADLEPAHVEGFDCIPQSQECSKELGKLSPIVKLQKLTSKVLQFYNNKAKKSSPPTLLHGDDDDIVPPSPKKPVAKRKRGRPHKIAAKNENSITLSQESGIGILSGSSQENSLSQEPAIDCETSKIANAASVDDVAKENQIQEKIDEKSSMNDSIRSDDLTQEPTDFVPRDDATNQDNQATNEDGGKLEERMEISCNVAASDVSQKSPVDASAKNVVTSQVGFCLSNLLPTPLQNDGAKPQKQNDTAAEDVSDSVIVLDESPEETQPRRRRSRLSSKMTKQSDNSNDASTNKESIVDNEPDPKSKRDSEIVDLEKCDESPKGEVGNKDKSTVTAENELDSTEKTSRTRGKKAKKRNSNDESPPVVEEVVKVDLEKCDDSSKKGVAKEATIKDINSKEKTPKTRGKRAKKIDSSDEIEEVVKVDLIVDLEKCDYSSNPESKKDESNVTAENDVYSNEKMSKSRGRKGKKRNSSDESAQGVEKVVNVEENLIVDLEKCDDSTIEEVAKEYEPNVTKKDINSNEKMSKSRGRKGKKRNSSDVSVKGDECLKEQPLKDEVEKSNDVDVSSVSSPKRKEQTHERESRKISGNNSGIQGVHETDKLAVKSSLRKKRATKVEEDMKKIKGKTFSEDIFNKKCNLDSDSEDEPLSLCRKTKENDEQSDSEDEPLSLCRKNMENDGQSDSEDEPLSLLIKNNDKGEQSDDEDVPLKNLLNKKSNVIIQELEGKNKVCPVESAEDDIAKDKDECLNEEGKNGEKDQDKPGDNEVIEDVENVKDSSSIPSQKGLRSRRLARSDGVLLLRNRHLRASKRSKYVRKIISKTVESALRRSPSNRQILPFRMTRSSSQSKVPSVDNEQTGNVNEEESGKTNEVEPMEMDVESSAAVENEAPSTPPIVETVDSDQNPQSETPRSNSKALLSSGQRVLFQRPSYSSNQSSPVAKSLAARLLNQVGRSKQPEKSDDDASTASPEPSASRGQMVKLSRSYTDPPKRSNKGLTKFHSRSGIILMKSHEKTGSPVTSIKRIKHVHPRQKPTNSPATQELIIVHSHVHSPSASPSGSILKKRTANDSDEQECASPTEMSRRVSFNENVDVRKLLSSGRISPKPVNRCLEMPKQNSSHPPSPLARNKKPEINTSALQYLPILSGDKENSNSENDSVPKPIMPANDNDSVTQLSNSSIPVSQLNDSQSICPELVDCTEPVDTIVSDLTTSMWAVGLGHLLKSREIKTIGDFARLTEVDVDTLPLKSPKIPTVRIVLGSVLSTWKQKNIDDENSSSASHALTDETAATPSSPDKMLPSADAVIDIDSPLSKGKDSMNSSIEGDLLLDTSNTSIEPTDQSDVNATTDAENLKVLESQLKDSGFLSSSSDASCDATSNDATMNIGDSVAGAESKVSTFVNLIGKLSEEQSLQEELSQLDSDEIFKLHARLIKLTSSTVLALQKKCTSFK